MVKEGDVVVFLDEYLKSPPAHLYAMIEQPSKMSTLKQSRKEYVS